MYWPSVGYLKGRFVEDGVRARVYGMLRIPLNVFVVVALGAMRGGEAYRNGVFLVCSGLLVVTSGIFYWIVGE
jgi:MFS transporter, MFS domain-containing protein family, molybdate-anion transporter